MPAAPAAHRWFDHVRIATALAAAVAGAVVLEIVFRRILKDEPSAPFDDDDGNATVYLVGASLVVATAALISWWASDRARATRVIARVAAASLVVALVVATGTAVDLATAAPCAC